MTDQNNGLPAPELLLDNTDVRLPAELPVLPLRDLVVFPFLMMPLHIGRPKSVKLVDEALVKDRLVALVTQKDGSVEDPNTEQLYTVGVAANIVRMLRMPDDTIRVLTRGISRVRIKRYTRTDPYMVGEIEQTIGDKISLNRAKVRVAADLSGEGIVDIQHEKAMESALAEQALKDFEVQAGLRTPETAPVAAAAKELGPAVEAGLRWLVQKQEIPFHEDPLHFRPDTDAVLLRLVQHAAVSRQAALAPL